MLKTKAWERMCSQYEPRKTLGNKFKFDQIEFKAKIQLTKKRILKRGMRAYLKSPEGMWIQIEERTYLLTVSLSPPCDLH